MRILLIQLRRLGDLILTTPAILALRHQFPEVRVTLAIAKESEPLLPAIGGIDDSFIVTRGVRDLALSKKLRGFDCVIDFTQNARSAWMSLASGARQRIASHQWKRKRRLRARFYNEFVPCAMKEMHTIDYNLALLEPLGIAGASAQPKLEIPRKAQDQAGVLIRNELSDRPFAIFHPGSTRAEKFWEPMRWADVIAFAKNQLDLHPVLSSGNSALERKHATEIRSHLTVPIFDFTDRLDLLTLAALIARARFLVTVDSAPMHLASATQTPQVVLFGPTNPFHWRPRTSLAAILFGASRSYDFQRRAPKHPMKQISTGSVIDAIRSLETAPAASAV